MRRLSLLWFLPAVVIASPALAQQAGADKVSPAPVQEAQRPASAGTVVDFSRIAPPTPECSTNSDAAPYFDDEGNFVDPRRDCSGGSSAEREVERPAPVRRATTTTEVNSDCESDATSSSCSTSFTFTTGTGDGESRRALEEFLNRGRDDDDDE